jgi:hypothetical protein
MNAAGPVEHKGDLIRLRFISAITSLISVLTMRFFSRASVAGSAQTIGRSLASEVKSSGIVDAGVDRGPWTLMVINPLLQISDSFECLVPAKF